MAASIGDFFVKIGLKIDNLQKLNSLTTQLDNASKAANNLVKNLNKLPEALKKLNIPIVVKQSGTNTTDKSKSQYKEPIGPLLGGTQYSEKAGPSIEYFKKDLKEKASAVKGFEQMMKDYASKQVNPTSRNAAAYDKPIGPQVPLPPSLPQYDKPIGPSIDLFAKHKEKIDFFSKAISGIGKAAGVSIGGETIGALLAGNLALGIFATAIGKAIEYVSKFITSVISFTEELFKFNVATGISVQSLQQWQYAAAKAGVAGKDVANALKGIQLAQAEIQLGEGNIAPWALLGIDPKQEPTAVLWQIHERIKQSAGLSEGMARLYAQKFGLSDDMYQMLRRDNLALSDLNRNMAVSQRQTATFDKLNGAIGQAKMQFSILGANIGEILAPAVQMVVDLVADLIEGFNLLMPVVKFLLEPFNMIFKLVNGILEGLGKILNWASGVYDVFTPEEGKQSAQRKTTNPATNWLSMSTEDKKKSTASSITPNASLSSSLNSNPSKVTGIENQNVNINLAVNGAGDPKKVAEMTTALIKKHLDNQNSSVLELSQLATV